MVSIMKEDQCLIFLFILYANVISRLLKMKVSNHTLSFY